MESYSKYYERNADYKYSLKKNIGYVIEWYSIDGKFFKEWFVHPNCSKALLNVSYVHTWDNPEKGLRQYLTHLPLHNVKIDIYEEN